MQASYSLENLPKAVFFDLDDTLFDHLYGTEQALSCMLSEHTCFQGVEFTEFERVHAELLEMYHLQMLQGKLGFEEQRLRRFKALFEHFGAALSHEAALEVARRYRTVYQQVRRPVAGSVELLKVVKLHTQIVIVSNNMLEEQKDKLIVCGLAPYVDLLVVSEEAGCTKPDPAIFEYALRKAGCRAEEVVMIGDSWSADIMGAQRAGIRAIWFNRRGVSCPDAKLADEILSLEPPESVLMLLCQ
jgi:putative hydrolase of the HAD superfamily